MNEIALSTYTQVQAILDNQLMNMEFHSVECLVSPESLNKVVLTINGPGILLSVHEGRLNNTTAALNFIPDDGDTTNDVIIGKNGDKSAMILIPFRESLVVMVTNRESGESGSIGVNYLLK